MSLRRFRVPAHARIACFLVTAIAILGTSAQLAAASPATQRHCAPPHFANISGPIHCGDFATNSWNSAWDTVNDNEESCSGNFNSYTSNTPSTTTGDIEEEQEAEAASDLLCTSNTAEVQLNPGLHAASFYATFTATASVSVVWSSEPDSGSWSVYSAIEMTDDCSHDGAGASLELVFGLYNENTGTSQYGGYDYFNYDQSAGTCNSNGYEYYFDELSSWPAGSYNYTWSGISLVSGDTYIPRVSVVTTTTANAGPGWDCGCYDDDIGYMAYNDATNNNINQAYIQMDSVSEWS